MNNTTIIGFVLFVLITLFVGSGVAQMAADTAEKVESRHSQLNDVLAELTGLRN